MATVSIKGGAKWEALLKAYASAKVNVKAGILKGATNTEGESIPEYAAYNEFGTSKIPARPFLRQTIDEYSDGWRDILLTPIYDNPANPDFKRGAVLAGEQMKSDIVATIQKGDFEPNAPATVAIKRAKGKEEPDHPLIDTGDMMKAVDYEVKEG